MRTTLPLLIILGAAAPAIADPLATTATAEPAPAWNVAVAPRLGAVLPTSKLHAYPMFGLELDYALPAANRRLVLGADLSLTRPSYDGTVMDPRIPGGSTSYTVKETEVVVGLTLGYRFADAGASLVPWAAAGPILHLLESTETTMFPDTNTATSTEVGVEAAGGVDIAAGPGYLLGGARIVYSKLDHQITGSTNAGVISLELGYRFVF